MSVRMEPFKTPSWSGEVFRENTGKLYVFRPNHITVMKAWPPVAWIKKQDNRCWRHCRPYIRVPWINIERRIRQLLNPPDEMDQTDIPFEVPDEVRLASCSQLVWLRWYAAIPVEIRRLVSRFSNRQWHMLSFLARCGDAASDLTVSNPALAYALASNWVFHKPAVKQPLRSARSLLKPYKRQRIILDWLNFPDTEACRKILAKIDPKAITVSSLLHLRRGMTDNEMLKAMSYLPQLNAGVIRIITDPGLFPFVTPALLEEVALRRTEKQKAKLAFVLRDTIAMHRLLSPNGQRLGRIRRLDQLELLHHTLVADMNRAESLGVDLSFPTPPIPGTDSIVPITSARELIAESRVQHNCVASYLENIAVREKYYIYKVLKPERCTLSIARHRNSWKLAELKRICNESPSEATLRMVREWLAGEETIVNQAAFLKQGDLFF
jgi:hypothetical protein